MLPEKPVLLVAACALVKQLPGDSEVRILLAQRPQGKNLAGLWEFPGGKLEQGESPEQALARELREELGIETAEAAFAPLSFASHAYEKFHLLMPFYLCRAFSGVPQPCEGQKLAWISPAELAADYHLLSAAPKSGAAGNGAVRYPLPPADIPLLPPLLTALGRSFKRLKPLECRQ